MSFAAIVGSTLGALLARSPLVMPLFIAAMGVSALATFLLARPSSRRGG